MNKIEKLRESLTTLFTAEGEKFCCTPNASWLRIAALAYFSPRLRLPIEPRRLWAASGSVGTAAWLGVSAA